MSGAVAKLDGKYLVIQIPYEKKPKPSKTGKSRIVASTGGFMETEAEVDGEKVKINVTAIIPKE